MVLLGVETALGVANFGVRFVIETVTLTARGHDVEVSSYNNHSGMTYRVFGADPEATYVVDTLAPSDRNFAVHYQRGGERDILDVTAKSHKEAKREAIRRLGEGAYIVEVAAV